MIDSYDVVGRITALGDEFDREQPGPYSVERPSVRLVPGS